MARRHRIRKFYESRWPAAIPLRKSMQNVRSGRPKFWSAEQFAAFKEAALIAWEKLMVEQRAYLAKTGGYLV